MASEVLKRYTDVLSLLDMMYHNRLALLSPSRWYDQNDALGLKRYSERRGEGSVYALCFAEGYERAHHWQLFAGHSHGLCIQFDKAELVQHLAEYKYPDDILHGPMRYCNLKEVSELSPIPNEVLPFLKRDTFEAEAEYRIVAWEEEWLASETYTIPIPASLLKKVILGPSMPDGPARTLKEIARSIDGFADIEITKSRLVNNARWEEVIDKGLGKRTRHDRKIGI